jgi:hypothetical protein
MIQICENAMMVAQASDSLKTMSVKMSTYFAGYQVATNVIQALNGALAYLLASYRLMSKGAFIIYNCVNPSLLVCEGIADQAVDILTKASRG